jgi:hypothetical protein
MQVPSERGEREEREKGEGEREREREGVRETWFKSMRMRLFTAAISSESKKPMMVSTCRVLHAHLGLS